MPGRIFQLNTSPGGVPKLALREAEVTVLGLTGDDHKFPDIHGGPERAVCLFSLERILELQNEGHPIFPGAVGENVTISGIDWDEVTPGQSCHWAMRCFSKSRVIRRVQFNSIRVVNGEYQRISQKLHPGYSRVYARVLRPGTD